jgi:L-asparagine oxygenase
MLCLRQDPNAVPTMVVGANDLQELLTSQALRALSLRHFEVRSPDSFGQPQIVTSDVRVLDGADDHLTMRLDLQGLLTSDREEGQSALRELFSVLNDSTVGTPVYLSPGDALVIDNRRAAHGRPAFHPVFDGTHRWFQRCLVRAEFFSCRSAIKREGVMLPYSRVGYGSG